MNLLIKQKETHKLRQQTYGCQGEGWGKEIVRAFGMDMYTLLYLKWITNKDLLYNAGDSVQYSVTPNWKMKSLSRVQLFATPWTVPVRLLCP